ncbi:tripartite-type tricarboxylate transporter receptor subunit TctC [Kribbella sp. VKM Ac-2527]|uniref:Tripartite-type tricarboxylate transporter receptor subunit TctC n=1 Tax=Kribbella caucasensis TaxID=2512215 RepID=A0A4R6J7E0_9ACTN|nr:tripartite tricarboxylate transporter substrate-binding protein [Kribbella sp. VKM Ac-2527]TDO30235.1 tripartite-type tricarboxylate transporter receptor subunit TctC [Kribbella sp. VKM Ac-2527]
MSNVVESPVTETAAEPGAPRRSAAIAVMAVFLALAVAAALVGSDQFNRKPSTTDGDFTGETVEVMIPLAAGGGTDTWARFVGQEMMRAVPGQPGFAPVNDEGGEGIIGTNRFARSAPKDGTEVLVSTATTVVPWVLRRTEVKYDFNSLVPLVANGTGGAVYARSAAGVRGVRDLINRDHPLTFGGISATGLDLTTLVAFDLLGVRVKAVFGFEGRGPVNLALQRGEVDLDYQTTSAWPSAVKSIIQDGTAVPLMSFGQLDANGEVVRDPNFPKLPTVPEVYRQLRGSAPTGPAFEAYKTLLGLTYTYQKAMWVPADTPVEAVHTLRAAAAEVGQDPGFRKKADKVLGGYPLEADEALADRVRNAYTVDESVRGYILDLLRTQYNVKLG